MSLICFEIISAFKEFNINQHCTLRHSGYDKFKGNITQEKCNSFRKRLAV